MKVIKRDYKRIIDELFKIGNKLIFVDCFIDNYTYESFKSDFKQLIKTPVTQDNFIELIAEIANVIIDRKNIYKEIIDKLIYRNNKYIETNGYHIMDFEKLKNIFDEDYVPSIYNQGVTANMMLLYYFSKNIFYNKLIEQLTEYYKIQNEKMNENKKSSGFDLLKGIEKPSIELIELNKFTNEEYRNSDSIDWNDVGTRFDCNYDSERKSFNNVKRGLILFLNTKLHIFSELSNKIDSYYTTLKQYNNKINAFLQKQEIIAKQIAFLKEENADLKNKYKKARKELLELSKLSAQVKKEDDKTKDKQILDLTKENNYLKTRIEKLEQEIEILQESKQINETIQENITIEEKSIVTAITKELPEYQTIVVLGGNWNSREKENLQKALPTCEIEFIESEKTLMKIDRIKNADLVIFDASKNAHGYYYKVKQNTQKLYHINKSSSEEVIKLWL